MASVIMGPAATPRSKPHNKINYSQEILFGDSPGISDAPVTTTYRVTGTRPAGATQAHIAIAVVVGNRRQHLQTFQVVHRSRAAYEGMKLPWASMNVGAYLGEAVQRVLLKAVERASDKAASGFYVTPQGRVLVELRTKDRQSVTGYLVFTPIATRNCN